MTKLILFLWLAMYLVAVRTSKLNVPHVLLPIFEDINVNFTLEAVDGGCYTWRTTRIDLVQLIPIDPDPDLGCSQKAIVSAVTKEKARNVAIVLAEEANTELILRVDVIVDVIHSLNISTTTKEIIMDEVPEIFKVFAFDSQGNLFTSLEGVEFDWKIVCLGPKKDLTVLRFMTFKESPYETPSEIQLFENQNKRGHIVLLAGIKSGSTKVQVRLPYSEYNHVNMCEVLLSVVANLIIFPADVYIMPGDAIIFHIFSMNNGKMVEIELPNLQYFLEAEAKDLASADFNTGEVAALKEGKTKIILHDRNAEGGDLGLKLPFATMNIVQPAYLTITVLPYKNFAILVSEQHDIIVEAFSGNDNKLYMGSGVEIRTEIGDAFHVQQRSKNGTWLTGWAKQEGIIPVQAMLEGIVHLKLGLSKIKPISLKNNIHAYPRIALLPSEVILPWDPISKPKYHVEINATGGDGKFLWISNNHSVGVVNQVGSVKTHSYGSFEVLAAMQKNHNNRQSAKFHILPPSRLEIVEYIMEAEVGSPIFLHIALFAERPGKVGEPQSYVPFTRCQELPFKVTTSESKFIRDGTSVTSLVGSSCANVAIIGHDVGTSKVTVQYAKERETLEDSVVISSYKPLKLVHPVDKVVLSVGTSIPLVFKDGPRSNIGRSSDLKRTVTSSNNLTVQAVDATGAYCIPGEDEFTVVLVLCRQLGTSEITLSVSNVPAVPNCKYKTAAVTVPVTCGKPRSLFLQPAIKVDDASSCPLDMSLGHTIIQSNQEVELDVIVKDENGHRFLNISSLRFDWATKPSEAATVKSVDATMPRLNLKGSLDFGVQSYQIITPKIQVGQINVRAKLVGYQNNVLRSYKIAPEWPEFIEQKENGSEILPIVTEISLYLVDDTNIAPEEITIYNHPANKQTVSVKQGSGYYELSLSNENVADVKYFETTREILITPISPGELRINLIDLCLVSRPAVITVTVVSVSFIRVEMSDKVELGKCISCIVKLYDEAENLLNVPDVGVVDLKYHFENEIASVSKALPDENSPWPVGEIHYVVTGQELGDTKLTFSMSGTDPHVSITPVDLQVFPPLYLYPRNATLIVGASVQYSYKGGPQPDANIEYRVSSRDVGEINADGILRGLKLGETKVYAKAVGVNPATGQKLIYAEDTVDLTVIPLTGVRIVAPLTRFQLGVRVPLWVTGIPEQLSPIILSDVNPPFVYDWDVGDPDIAKIQGKFQTIGVKYKPEDDISLQLIGTRPGRTKLYLNVTVPGISANCPKKISVVFKDSIDIEVFEELVLISPSQISCLPVLMAPHSNLQLQTNLDSVYKISYNLLSEGIPSGTELETVSEPIVTISDTGLLTSHGNLGYATVLIVANNDHGLKRSLTVIVKVKMIHYMILNAVADWMLPVSGPNNVIPLGTEFELRVTYHDNTGSIFTAVNVDLRVRASRFDLVKIKPGSDNSSLIVSVKKPGQVVLKVWIDGARRIADYVKLHIQQTIAPVVDSLITGDIVCFWTPVTSETPVKWWSSDYNLLAIDGNTGIARVVGENAGHVAVSNNLHPVASVQLQILPVTYILLIRKSEQVLTNAPSAKVFRVSVVFTNDVRANRRSNFVNGWQCEDKVADVTSYPFKCVLKFSNDSIELSPDSLFNVRSNFVTEEGTYTCDLVTTGLNSPSVSTLDTNVILSVKTDNYVLSEPVEIPFIPAIYCNSELVLDSQTYTAELVIAGTDNALDVVTVTSFDRNLLRVYEGERTSQLLRHEVRLLDYHWKLDELVHPLYLTVNSKLTGEKLKITVKVQAGDKFYRPECALQHGIVTALYNNRQTFAILASILVIFLVTFYAYSNYVQPVINVNVTPTRSVPNSPPGTLADSISKTCIASNQCSAVAYMKDIRRSPQTTYLGGSSNLNTSNTSSPVYGDPTSFYSTSPELRRNRRYI